MAELTAGQLRSGGAEGAGDVDRHAKAVKRLIEMQIAARHWIAIMMASVIDDQT